MSILFNHPGKFNEDGAEDLVQSISVEAGGEVGKKRFDLRSLKGVAGRDRGG